MGVVKTILLIAFIIVCVLTILLVLMQNDEGNGMGTAFGGGQSAAFGSHSASVLVKTTGVLAGLFFIIVFVLLLLNKPAKRVDLTEKVEDGSAVEETVEESSNWLDEELKGAEESVELKAE